MKQSLLILFFLYTTMSIAQTTWTGLGAGSNWNIPENWSNNTIPSSNDDVVIPSGFSVNIDANAFTKSISLQGNATLNLLTAELHITNASVFDTNSTFNWSGGFFLGGGLTNPTNLNAQGTINILSPTSVAMRGNLKINNTGIINIISGELAIQGAELNNTASGIIDLQSPNRNISGNQGAHILTNSGMIVKNTSSTTAKLQIDINNNDGIFQINNGSLELYASTNTGLHFTNGEYNVSTGATLIWSASILKLSGTIHGTLDGILNIGSDSTSGNMTVDSGETTIIDFTGNGTINWYGGTLNGGGILINKDEIFLRSINFKRIRENTTLINEGILTIISDGDLAISEGVIENMNTIDMQADGGNIIWVNGNSHVLNNSGLIKKTISTGEAQINVQFNNNNGTVSVESGTLSLGGQLENNLTDGIYNVFLGANFDWDSTIYPSGILTGNLAGNINWNNTVNIASVAAFNFTGNGIINWNNFPLTGGGILTNQSIINLLTNGGSRRIEGNTTLNNENIINFLFNGNFFIAEGIINNQLTGIIDFKEDSNIRPSGNLIPQRINNLGLIKKSNIAGSSSITVEISNSGIIDVGTAEIAIEPFNLPFTNEVSGIIKGVGTLKINSANNYTNLGTFSPGFSPGTLTVNGNFMSSTSSILDIELNGLIQSTEYDLLAIQGNAIMDGIVNVTLGFTPSINDEFIIATTTGSITSCNLATPISTTFNGNTYTFDVICRNGNEVVLTVRDPLSVNEFETTTISVYPNPTQDFLFFNDTNNTIEHIQLISLSGKIILNQQLNEKFITLSNFSKGIYFIKIYSKQSAITKKIILN